MLTFATIKVPQGMAFATVAGFLLSCFIESEIRKRSNFINAVDSCIGHAFISSRLK